MIQNLKVCVILFFKEINIMETLRLENSPITYYIENSTNKDWVVFIHAAFVDYRMFEKQFEYFKGKYNILAVDIFGHGNSVKAKRGDSIEKMSYWLEQIFKKHNIPVAHFVGVSLGAVFAQDFANKYENKVLSLACFGGYDINNFDPKNQKGNSKQQMKRMFKAIFSIKWFAKANKTISAHTPQAQEEFYNLNVKFKKSSFRFLAGLNKLVNKFPNKLRPYKLLVGCGEFDIPSEIDIVNKWAESQHCDKAIIKNAGHCANMDNPNEFNACLEDFWQNNKKEKAK